MPTIIEYWWFAIPLKVAFIIWLTGRMRSMQADLHQDERNEERSGR